MATVDQGELSAKSFAVPDETRPFKDKGRMEVVRFGDTIFGKGDVRAGLEVVGAREADRGDRELPGPAHRLRARRAG